MKYSQLMQTRAKAILIVADPKSGYKSLMESDPQMAGYYGARIFNEENRRRGYSGSNPNVIYIHRNLADNILKDTGFTLEDLQNSIDQSLKSSSFAINKKIAVNIETKVETMTLKNVAAYIEGSDPVLKNEVVVYSAHYDHIGGYGDKIFVGADDNASGCAALLEMAQAFMSLKTKPRRTILFLWVSGEEIGLLGSAAYVKNPLFPLENTVANLNMDMIGRVKGIADTTYQNPMSCQNTVFLITGNQSSDLQAIADRVEKKINLDFDYSLSGQNHPLQLFSRSDQYNFVKNDIPVLFFSTGLHTDYHTPRDVIELLDFNKMEAVTRAMYKIGFEVANRKTRIAVDNPFSRWGK
jgi:Zn-dependent M28 family amino/carboxypeptidase